VGKEDYQTKSNPRTKKPPEGSLLSRRKEIKGGLAAMMEHGSITGREGRKIYKKQSSDLYGKSI